MADELLRALGRRQAQPPPGLANDPERGEPAPAGALLRPFEGQERAALLDDVLAGLDAEPHAQASTSARAAANAGTEPTSPPVELGARRRRTLAWAGLATLLAASLALWLGLRGTTPPDEALPSYAVTRLDGGSATMRSGPAPLPSSITLAPDAEIDWILTPRAPVRTPVGAVLLASAPGQPARLVRPEALQVSDEGVVRITGPLASVLPLPSGSWSVTVVLGAPDALPRTIDEAMAGEGRAWSRVTFEVTIVPAP